MRSCTASTIQPGCGKKTSSISAQGVIQLREPTTINDATQTQSLLAETDQALQSLQRAQIEPDEPSPVHQTLDAVLLQQIIEDLRRLLGDNDTEALTVHQQLHGALAGSQWQAQGERMSACMERFDFDSALQELEQLIHNLTDAEVLHD